MYVCIATHLIQTCEGKKFLNVTIFIPILHMKELSQEEFAQDHIARGRAGTGIQVV